MLTLSSPLNSCKPPTPSPIPPHRAQLTTSLPFFKTARNAPTRRSAFHSKTRRFPLPTSLAKAHPSHGKKNKSKLCSPDIVQSPTLISIDYDTDHDAVYLSVDLSVRSVRWTLVQDCSNGRHCPSRFGTISWDERRSRYSQAKLELYGLFRVLRATRLHLIGVRNLVVCQPC